MQVAFKRSGSSAADARKPLLIKSPVHTARIDLLVQLFPKARFIYLHRHPYEARMRKRTPPVLRLALSIAPFRPQIVAFGPHLGPRVGFTPAARMGARDLPRWVLVLVLSSCIQVFQSAVNMAEKYYCYSSLERPKDRDLTGFIMDQYSTLFNRQARGGAPS